MMAHGYILDCRENNCLKQKNIITALCTKTTKKNKALDKNQKQYTNKYFKYVLNFKESNA